MVSEETLGTLVRKRLATAALMGCLLGSIAHLSPVAAQPVQPPSSAAAFGYTRAPPADTVAKPKKAVRGSRFANKRHVFRSHPNQRRIAEREGYKRVSDLVNFPKFFPGLGIIFVKPETLPIGPFLCFDRNDRLIATVYMVPIKDINDHKSFEAPGFAGRADHVSLYFNPGHPGVDVPHYHLVIWQVTKKEEARVAK
jgi:hypothetical protein